MPALRSGLVFLTAAAAMVAVSVAIVAGGRAMQRPVSTAAVLEPATSDPMPDPGPIAAQPEATAAIARPQQPLQARPVAPAIAPGIQPEELERVEPRGALGELGLAQPPKRKMFGGQDGSTLYRPVVVAAGLIEAKGYRVAIAGVDIVAADESCEHAGKTWPCGVFARAALRAFLRGRAVNCAIPPEVEGTEIVAECRLGKQDVGLWLASNGWARAVAGGPYREAGDKAIQDGKGIFGAAPDTDAPPAPTAESNLPAPSETTTSPLAPAEPLMPAEPLAPVVPVTPPVDL